MPNSAALRRPSAIAKVDAGELAAGQTVRHGDEIAAAAAPDFEDPAGGDRRGRHSE
jgi:hypothetical protein